MTSPLPRAGWLAQVREPNFGDYLRRLRDGHSTVLDSPSRRLRWSRTELAAAANQSQSWITKLEQGRGLPRRDVVDKLADVLRIEPIERQHLHDLAQPPSTEPERPGYYNIADLQKRFVDHLSPHLSAWVDEAWNVYFCNDEYARVFRKISRVGNVLRWFFEVPESQTIMLEWEREARLTVAWLRALMARRPGNAMFLRVLRDLEHEPSFVRMWNEQQVTLGRTTPVFHLHDLDRGRDVTLLVQVLPSGNPQQAVQMYLGVLED